MKILFIGDTVGKAGRKMIDQHLYQLKKQYEIDFVVLNGENLAHGKGITQSVYDEILNCGVDCVTMGNHTFDKAEILDWVEHAHNLVIPANVHRSIKGNRTKVFQVKNKKVQVTNLLGRVFFDMVTNLPIDTLEDIVAESSADIHIVDLHAEATAEKIAFGFEFDGKVSAILGTHTHVQTADECILNKGTAYITDVGMTGPQYSCIGMDNNNVLYKMKTGLPARFEVSNNKGQLCAVVIDFDDKTNKATSIERLFLKDV